MKFTPGPVPRLFLPRPRRASLKLQAAGGPSSPRLCPHPLGAAAGLRETSKHLEESRELRRTAEGRRFASVRRPGREAALRPPLLGHGREREGDGVGGGAQRGCGTRTRHSPGGTSLPPRPALRVLSRGHRGLWAARAGRSAGLRDGGNRSGRKAGGPAGGGGEGEVSLRAPRAAGSAGPPRDRRGGGAGRVPAPRDAGTETGAARATGRGGRHGVPGPGGSLLVGRLPAPG